MSSIVKHVSSQILPLGQIFLSWEPSEFFHFISSSYRMYELNLADCSSMLLNIFSIANKIPSNERLDNREQGVSNEDYLYPYVSNTFHLC